MLPGVSASGTPGTSSARCMRNIKSRRRSPTSRRVPACRRYPPIRRRQAATRSRWTSLPDPPGGELCGSSPVSRSCFSRCSSLWLRRSRSRKRRAAAAAPAAERPAVAPRAAAPARVRPAGPRPARARPRRPPTDNTGAFNWTWIVIGAVVLIVSSASWRCRTTAPAPRARPSGATNPAGSPEFKGKSRHVSVRLYPYVLEPKLTAAIWGGDALVTRYGKPGDRAQALGESWECWDENRVANGALAGKTLGELRAELGDALTGPIDPARTFPVLTKIIDAREPLSVQVHPDDAYAQRVEHQPNGKTECWYVLACEPGAELVLGWARDTSREEYERRVADGTLGEILRRVPVARRRRVLSARRHAARDRRGDPAVRDAAGQRPDVPHLRLEPRRAPTASRASCTSPKPATCSTTARRSPARCEQLAYARRRARTHAARSPTARFLVERVTVTRAGGVRRDRRPAADDHRDGRARARRHGEDASVRAGALADRRDAGARGAHRAGPRRRADERARSCTRNPTSARHGSERSPPGAEQAVDAFFAQFG